jgi:hypothetical protein
VQPRHSHVVGAHHPHTQLPKNRDRLLGERDVARARGEDSDGSRAVRYPQRPIQSEESAAGEGSNGKSSRALGREGPTLCRSGSRDQRPATVLVARSNDPNEVCHGLSFSEDHLGNSDPSPAVLIELGEFLDGEDTRFPRRRSETTGSNHDYATGFET